MNKDNEMYPKTKKLSELLLKIGYSVTHQGCGFYRVRDHKGNATAFEIRSDQMEIKPAVQNSKLFRRGWGSIKFNLSICDIVLDDNYEIVSIIIGKGGKEQCFVSFYKPDNI